MSFAVKAVSDTHTYYGNSTINFFPNVNEGLSVTIDTNRLHIRSVEATKLEYDRYALLFGDTDVMEKFATGQTEAKDDICARINTWAKRWRESDPYSGLAVFKKDTDDFLGHVTLGHSEAPGESELAYLFKKTCWGQRYGSEAVTAVVNEYAPATVQEGYTLEGKVLEKIVATARTDNIASCRILEKVGMHCICVKEKYGALRNHYSIELQKKSSFWRCSIL